MDDVVVLGCGLSPFRSSRFDGSIRDWVAEAVLAALADSGLEHQQIDQSLMAYESDHLAGQIGQGVIWHDTLGLTPRPTARIEGCGATGGLALRSAFAYLRAGLSRCLLVVGAERVGKSVSTATAGEIFAMSSDTDWEFPVGGHFTAYYALLMREHMRRYGTTEEQLALVSVKNHGNARYHPLAQKPKELTVDEVLASPLIASPYKLLDCSLLSDGAAAVILANRSWAQANVPRFSERPVVALTGSGCATDYARAGDRPRDALAHFTAKRLAGEAAYAMAGISEPLEEIDVAEVYDSYTGAELMAYEALGFCPPGASGPLSEEGVFSLQGELPVNPSGGLLGFGAAAGATGVAQAVEITAQLRGEADPRRQVAGAKRGLSDCHAGTCTVAAVHIFERKDI
ncbi:MAG: thiolase domain-containing protein [Gemmatimonadota bacterium]|nr:MAG: thiolase domain-containing protein [Gemmatimonadota bacterium]